MKNVYRDLSLNEEIRIGINCIKKGLIEINLFGYGSRDIFIPLLLFSVGFERILKVLYCFSNYNKTQSYPNKNELRKIGHSLQKLTKEFIMTCESFPLYKKASGRIDDLQFLKENEDFKLVIDLLNQFSTKDGRYYNLNVVTESSLNSSKPEDLFSIVINLFAKNSKIDINEILKPEFNIYEQFNPFFIGIIQKFTRILSFGFTQGAFGDKARQLSAFELNDFLHIKDNELCKINFK